MAYITWSKCNMQRIKNKEIPQENIPSLTALSVAIAFSRGMHYNGYRNLFSDEEFIIIDKLIQIALSQTPNWFHWGMVKMMKKSPYSLQQAFFSKFGVSGYDQQIAGRKFMLRHKIEKAIEKSVTQVVILGGGYDTAAFHLSKKYPHVNFYELDRSITRLIKVKALASIENTRLSDFENDSSSTAIFNSNLRFIQCDLVTDKMNQILKENNFDAQKDTLFIAEGLTMYLTQQQIEQILLSIHSLLKNGNEIVLGFLYSQSLITSNVSDQIQRSSNERYKFVLSPNQVFKFAADSNFLLSEKILGITLLERMGDFADAHLRQLPNAPSEDYYTFKKAASLEKDIEKNINEIPDMQFDIPIVPEQKITHRSGCAII